MSQPGEARVPLDGGTPDSASLNLALHLLGHDLRNGLNALQLNALCMLQSDLPRELREGVESSTATIRELGALIDLMVISSDLHVGRLAAAIADESVSDVLAEAAAVLRREHPGRDIRLEESGELPSIAVDTVLLVWVIRAVARSGFDSGDGALILGAESADGACRLSVAGDPNRIAMRPAGAAAWREPAARAAIELEVARQVTAQLGGRLESEPSAKPPRWRLHFPARPQV